MQQELLGVLLPLGGELRVVLADERLEHERLDAVLVLQTHAPLINTHIAMKTKN